MKSEYTETQSIEAVNRIQNAIADSERLTGPKIGIASLLSDYSSDRVYREKVETLTKRMANMRRIRPDGNCFYRAYLFGILELGIVTSPATLPGLKSKFEALAVKCKEAGYDAFAIDDFHDMLLEQLEVLASAPSVETIESTIFSDPSVDGYLIAFMRCCCGAFLKKHSDEFSGFLPSPYSTIDAFVRNEVDPMFKECDEIQVVACTRVFGIPVKIVYLDRSDGDLNIHKFGESDDSPSVYMLYRPGHYDLIYPY